MLPKSKFVLGEDFQTPSYKYLENILGYETAMTFLDGLPAERVRYFQCENTRKTSPYLNQLIKTRWEEIKNKSKQAFDAPRARFEGCAFNQEDGNLWIFWSEDRYSTHAAMRDTIVPKPYQANLFTINGIPLTKDGKIPVAVRNPMATDQGRIRHITPAGFIDLKKIGNDLVLENTRDAVIRKFLDEIDLPSPYKMETLHKATKRELDEEIEISNESGVDAEKMRLLGIVYNYRKNFDYAASVLIPMEASSHNVRLKGKEHEEIGWVNTNLDSLKSTLYELAIAPETNSGHLRGDIALTIGHLYGKDCYVKTLEEIVLELSKLK
ncbi:MAG TPA: hypothetical protein VJ343_00025 [archaeon]|nr:hypothetical protein [archaeon]